MMREDHDIVNRSATGKKIGVKKMPKAGKEHYPFQRRLRFQK